MKHAYVEKRFQPKSLVLIDKINEIVNSYQQQGYSLTLRQTFYQLVSRGIIPNLQSEYKRIGALLNDARWSGLVSWTAIEDRSRHLDSLRHWKDPKDMIVSASKGYHINLLEGQPHYIECWVEKEALSDVVWQAAAPYDVPCFACKGFPSASELWRASKRFIRHNQRECSILYLGDHDPSGLDIPRDIADRLSLLGANVSIKRLALNLDQIQQYNPPPNPAKETDTRFARYKDKYGDESWELDALEPQVLDALITENIISCLDRKLFDEIKKLQETQRKELIELAANF